MATSKIKHKLRSVKLLLIAVILLAIFATFGIYKNIEVLVGKSTEINSSFDFVAETSATNNGLTKYNLKFRTGKERENNSVSVVSFRLKLGSGVELVNESGEPTDMLVLTEELSNNEKWTVAINSIYKEGESRYIDFSVVNLEKNGYMTDVYTTIGSFYVRDTKGEVKIEVVPESSFAFTKSRPVTNIWQTSGEVKIN